MSRKERRMEVKNGADFRNAVPQIYYVESLPKKSSSKKIIFVIILLVILIITFIMGAGVFTTYRMADSGKFEIPYRIGKFFFWDGDFKDYTASGMFLENEMYDNAAAHFKRLGNYRNSEAFYKESLYRTSQDKYSRGLPEEALEGFQELGDYKDSAEFEQNTRSLLYIEAVKLFEEGSYNKSSLLFDKANIEESDKYQTVIDVIQGDKYIYSLKEIVDFQPAKDCLVMNDTNFIGFMEGEWYTQDKDVFLSVESDEEDYYALSFNLPHYYDSGDHYSIKDGGVYFSYDENGTGEELTFVFHVEDWDTVNVDCVDGETYTLYRE